MLNRGFGSTIAAKEGSEAIVGIFYHTTQTLLALRGFLVRLFALLLFVLFARVFS